MNKKTLNVLLSTIISGAMLAGCSGKETETVEPSPTKPKPTATYTAIPPTYTPALPTDTPIPEGIEGIDYPVYSKGVDFKFFNVEFMEQYGSGEEKILPGSINLPGSLEPYDWLAIITAESKNFTSDYPCEEKTEYATSIAIGFTMPNVSRGGGSWLFCETYEDGFVKFVFPTYKNATEYSIRLPGEPAGFVNDIPLDSLINGGG